MTGRDSNSVWRYNIDTQKYPKLKVVLCIRCCVGQSLWSFTGIKRKMLTISECYRTISGSRNMVIWWTKSKRMKTIPLLLLSNNQTLYYDLQMKLRKNVRYPLLICGSDCGWTSPHSLLTANINNRWWSGILIVIDQGSWVSLPWRQGSWGQIWSRYLRFWEALRMLTLRNFFRLWEKMMILREQFQAFQEEVQAGCGEVQVSVRNVTGWMAILSILSLWGQWMHLRGS